MHKVKLFALNCCMKARSPDCAPKTGNRRAALILIPEFHFVLPGYSCFSKVEMTLYGSNRRIFASVMNSTTVMRRCPLSRLATNDRDFPKRAARSDCVIPAASRLATRRPIRALQRFDLSVFANSDPVKPTPGFGLNEVLDYLKFR